MDAHEVEQELRKLSGNHPDMGSDSDTDIEEDFSLSNEKLENDLPDSMLSYFKASSNRVNTFEQLILEDLDDLETMCNEMFGVSQHADLLNELGSDFEEDPLRQKEIIMSEIEEQLGSPCETYDSNEENDTEYDTHKDSERQLMFEWRQMEDRLKKEDEQSQAELEAEKEQYLKLEETRRYRNEQFKERISRAEATNQFEISKAEGEDGEISQSVQVEVVKQQELIKRLEDQIVEERQAFEEVQQKEVKRTEARHAAAATKIQAAFRGALVRQWSKKELTKRREEEKRKHEKRKERERRQEMEEVVKLEREKERQRVEQEQQHHREEAERRRAEYERSKEQERHRLERERKLEEQKRKETEEAKRIEDENQRRVGEMRIEDEMKKVQKVEKKKTKAEENAKSTESELKRKEGKEACERVDKRRLEEGKRERQQHMENISIEKENVTEEEIKRRDEMKSPEMMEDRRIREVRREVHDDKEKTRKAGREVHDDKTSKAEEKTKEIEDEMKIKDEEKEKERRAEEETRKKVEEAKRIEDESKRKEEEMQKSMEIWEVEQEKRNVQVDEEKERKEIKKAKRTEDEKKMMEEIKHKQIKERRRKEEKEGKQREAEIIIKEEEEKQKMVNEERVEENIRLKQNEQLKGNKTEQLEKEQRKKNEIIGEQIVIKRNDDRQNSEEIHGHINEDSVKGCFEQREDTETDKESRITTKRLKEVKFSDISQGCLSQSVNISKSFMAKTLSSTNGQDEQLSSHLVSTLPSMSSENSSVTVGAREKESVTDTRGLQCALHDSSFACLPDSTEQKQLGWMMNCTPWAKLSTQSKRNSQSAPPRRREHKRASGHSLVPLPVDIILKSGPWSSLKEVTSVTLEDLSSCSLSTLSECTRLQSLTLRRCRLQALDGLKQCTQLQHIDLQENSITYVDCGGLARLEVLLLGRNRLTSIHGLDDAINLTVLQLSHNIISRISGLGSLKKLHHLTVDHNQLISTRGLSETFTLLHVDCSYNHISHVEGLENCALLNTLDLRGNNLTELPVLENHVLLRELYLDDNSICSLHGLDSCWLPLLRCLSVPQNSITQLPLLVDLLSLKTFNVSHNCLSELSNICMSLQGCSHLQELSIFDNPVQQDNTWRSSVLAVNPSLIKLNGEQTGASRTLSADSTQLWSFQALCQAHQEQIDSVLQRHGMEISSSPSALHAQLLVGKHSAELFQLAEKQRYDHEYGDSRVYETATQEPVNLKVKDQQPEEHKSLSWQAPCPPNITHQSRSSYGDHNADCGGRCLSPTHEFSNTQPGEDRHSKYYAHQQSRMDLKTVAVMVIQRRWREHRQKKRTDDLGPPAKAHARLRLQKELQSCKSRPGCLNKDYAATIIQAVWRGYSLRKRLTRALMLAQISDGDEAFEEVDIDEFVFDEEAMERNWNTLRSDMSSSSVLPYLEQLPLPKPVLPLPELHKKTSVQPWKPRQAWISGEEAPVSEQSQSSDSCGRIQYPASTLKKYSLSERSEKILKEWGFSNSSTALLMLKRAQRMKARKQQYQRKVQNPAVHLALFRNHNVRPDQMKNHKSRLEFREELKVGRGNLSVQEAPQVEPGQKQMQMHTLHRTYQWLQTQAVPSQRSAAPSVSDHFLPEIDPEILNGGRVQLVASTGSREGPDSAMSQWIVGTAFSSLQHHQAYTRTRSAGHSKKEVPSPQRVTLAPSRKERISFRDNPVQLSGGWGGGKKRSKANNLK